MPCTPISPTRSLCEMRMLVFIPRCPLNSVKLVNFEELCSIGKHWSILVFYFVYLFLIFLFKIQQCLWWLFFCNRLILGCFIEVLSLISVWQDLVLVSRTPRAVLQSASSLCVSRLSYYRQIQESKMSQAGAHLRRNVENALASPLNLPCISPPGFLLCRS